MGLEDVNKIEGYVQMRGQKQQENEDSKMMAEKIFLRAEKAGTDVRQLSTKYQIPWGTCELPKVTEQTEFIKM